MQVNELRIGNWITSKSSRIPFQVTIEDFVFILENIEHYKPIFVTEEHLFNLGATVQDSTIVLEIETDIKIVFERDTRAFFLYFDNGYNGVDIGYIHKLQNLIFELKDEELEIKP